MKREIIRSKTAAITAGIAALALLATACGSSSASTGGASGTVDSGAPVQGGTIVYGADREPTCLDPHNFGDMPQTYAARQFLDSLVSEKPDGSVVPWLASSWTISKDGLVYTFHLKPGVKFTDGTPFNAAAVKANFDQILDPRTQSATDAGYLKPYYKSVTVINDDTVAINLKAPYSALLDVLAQAFFGMESPTAMARGLNANCQSPVGTGPFIVKSWVHGQEIDFVRNPNYNSAPANAKHQGPAYASALTWKFLEDPSVRFAALQSGTAQLIFNPPPQDNTALTSDSSLTVLNFLHSGLPNGVALNTTRPPFNDIKVRQAFRYASDAPAAVKSAYFGVLPSASGAVGAGTPDYDPAYEHTYDLNTTKANQLLDEAGWKTKNSQGYRTKDGKALSVKFIYSSNSGDTPPADVAIFQDIQAAEKKVGIDVVLTPLPRNEYFNAFTSKTAYDALSGAYWNSPTPAVLVIVYSTSSLDAGLGNNMSFVSDPKLDTILAQASATTDPAKQKDLYGQAQAIVDENAWQLPLYPETTRLGVRTSLHDVWIEPSEGEPVLSDAWIQN